MAILTVNNIKKMFGTDVILENVSFEVQKGDRIGLVGINGSGKTTLFKILNGEYTADEGSFTPARETSIGYMEQHVCRDMEKPAFDEVMTVFEPVSYTHLDVYKRQDLHRVPQRGSQHAVVLTVAVCAELLKRLFVSRLHKAPHEKVHKQPDHDCRQELDQQHRPDVCLLYTSRCV